MGGGLRRLPLIIVWTATLSKSGYEDWQSLGAILQGCAL